jgi:5'-nucleotidase
MDYEKAAKIALPFIRKLIDIHTGGVININIPRLSYGEPKGVRVVPQAVGGFNEYYEVIDQHDGERVYQLSGGEPGKEDKVADSNSLISGYITITPLMADMTDHDRLESLKQDGLES